MTVEQDRFIVQPIPNTAEIPLGWRRVVSIGDEISFERVGIDIASAPVEVRGSIIADWQANISDTLSQTSDKGEWFEGMQMLNVYIEFKRLELEHGE